MLPMTATLRKKIDVSALAIPRGSLPEGFIGQIRENASIIFTNFVCGSCPRETPNLTTSTGHGSFFDPPSRGLVEAVRTTLLAEVSERLKSTQILQEPKAGRGR